MSAPTELLVVMFQGESRAAEVLEAVKRLRATGALHLGNAAVITRNAQGHTSVNELKDLSPGEGAAAGAALGALVGALRGNLLADTLIGAGVGWLASETLDLGFSDTFLHQIASQLSPNTSALALAVEFDRLDEALHTLGQYHGTILHQTLSAEQARQLKVAMEGVQAPS